jgi:hypothetical protein
MLEVKPKELEAGSSPPSTIGQVVLKRLLSADQVIERLCQETFFHLSADSTPFTMADLEEESLHPSSERHVMNPSVSANQTFATLEAKTAYSSAPLS